MKEKIQQFTSWKWTNHIAFLVLVFLPPLLLALLMARYSVNVPFWDSWELVPIFEKIQNGSVGFVDFFAQHNEHRLLFPRLIMVALAELSHWNVFYEIVTNFILASISFIFLCLILRRTFSNKKHLTIALIMVSAVLFSPIQFENWIWGWQIQWFLNVLSVVIAIWALSSTKLAPIWRLTIAVLAAIVATYSLASGLFVWLVCLPLFLMPQIRKFLPLWIGFAVVTIGSHYIGYHDPEYHPSKLLFLGDPLGLLEYFLVYMARPLVMDYLESLPIAFAYFMVTFGVIAFFIKRRNANEVNKILPWAAIGLYSIFAGLSTSLSRLGLGVEQAYSNRYTTLSSLLLITIIVGLVWIYGIKVRTTNDKRHKLVSMIALSSIFLLVSWNFYLGSIQMKERHLHLLTVKDCAENASSENDECLLKLYPDKSIVWERLQFVRREHWSDLSPLDN